MKLEVEAGQFVRMSDGQIVKIPKKTSADDIEFAFMEQDILGNKIKKASHNIINLIEVGDYVNGYKVVDIKIFSDGNKYVVIATEEHQSFWKDKVFEDEIKSIVTKEQFKANEYVVE